MSRTIHPKVTYDRLLKEARNSLRVCRVILQAQTLAEAQILAAGLEHSLERWLSIEIPPKKRRR